MQEHKKPSMPMLLVHWLDASSGCGHGDTCHESADCYSLGMYTGEDMRRVITLWRDVYLDGDKADVGKIPIGTIERWAYLQRRGPWRTPGELRTLLG